MIKESNDGSLFDFEEINPIQDKVEPKEDGKPKEDDNQIIGLLNNDEFEKNLGLELNPEKEEEVKDLEDEDTEDEKPVEESKKDKSEKKEEVVDEDKPEASYSFKGIAAYLDEEGIIDFEDSKDIEDSPELLVELVQSKVDNLVKDYKESLPPVVAELTDYIERGGDPEKFLKSLTKDIDLANLDMEDEKNQELLVKEYLKSMDHSKEEIDELINDYKESLTLDKHAKFASRKLEKIQESKKERLLQEQEAEIEAQKQRVESYKSSVKDTIISSAELGGLPISKKEKDDFAKYLLEVNPRTGLTKYQEDVSENQLKTQIELAYLKYKKYDFSSVKKKAETEAAKDLRSKIFTKTESTPKGKSKESQAVQNFEAFKAMFGRK